MSEREGFGRVFLTKLFSFVQLAAARRKPPNFSELYFRLSQFHSQKIAVSRSDSAMHVTIGK
jgi:hypothetical protein